MAQLLLAKHSQPEVTPGVVSHRWVLSEAGRQRCGWLAGEWREHGVQRLFASLEPKALETAALVGAELGLPVYARQGLQENDRTGLAYLPADELERTISRFFATPDSLVIGRETAATALARFEAGLRAIAAQTRQGAVGVVAHGTVISLLVAAHNATPPLALWRSLALPSYLALDASSLAWDGVVHRSPAE